MPDRRFRKRNRRKERFDRKCFFDTRISESRTGSGCIGDTVSKENFGVSEKNGFLRTINDRPKANDCVLQASTIVARSRSTGYFWVSYKFPFFLRHPSNYFCSEKYHVQQYNIFKRKESIYRRLFPETSRQIVLLARWKNNLLESSSRTSLL